MDMLRQKVFDYMEKYGTPKIWFSRKLGISQTHFNLYLKQERELSEKLENALRQLIEDK